MGMNEFEIKELSDNHFDFLCRKLKDIFSESLHIMVLMGTARAIQNAVYDSLKKLGKDELERVEFDMLFLNEALKHIEFVRECCEKDIDGTIGTLSEGII